MPIQSFYVVKELRLTLLVRCFVGLIALISFTVGAALASITVQLTVGNLAPFVAGTLGYIFIKEKMNKFEIIAMFISLGAVILIGIVLGNRSDKDEEEEKTYIFFGTDAQTAAIVGFFVQIIKSFANGSLSVQNRILQSVEVQVTIVYTSLVSLVPMIIGLLIENSLSSSDDPFRILNYTSEQYLYCIGIALSNHGALYFAIVAFQNERSGFISLLAYIGLVYAFLIDIFLFNESFNALLLIGIITIFIINMALIFTKMCKQSDINIDDF